MTAAGTSPVSRWAPVAVGLTVAFGISAGWRLASAPTPTLDYARAVLSPAGLAALCVIALVKSPRRARWLVPLILTAVLLDVVNHPHVPALSVIGVVAAVAATLACLMDRRHLAVAGTLICCASTSVSLLVGLSTR